MFQYCYARVILFNVEEVIILKHRCYISASEHTRMLILSSYVLLACINKIYKYGHAWVINEMDIKFQMLCSGALYLRFETCLECVIRRICSYLMFLHWASS